MNARLPLVLAGYLRCFSLAEMLCECLFFLQRRRRNDGEDGEYEEGNEVCLRQTRNLMKVHY